MTPPDRRARGYRHEALRATRSGFRVDSRATVSPGDQATSTPTTTDAKWGHFRPPRRGHCKLPLPKDRAHNGNTGGAGRVVVWRMSPYERRRGGNAPPGGLEAAPARVTPAPGKGALGTRWPRQSGTHQTQSWITRGPASWRRGKANSTASGRRVRQHRSFARWGKARPEKWRAEPRPEPDSGNPTVRDRRGASGNVASWSKTPRGARA